MLIIIRLERGPPSHGRQASPPTDCRTWFAWIPAAFLRATTRCSWRAAIFRRHLGSRFLPRAVFRACRYNTPLRHAITTCHYDMPLRHAVTTCHYDMPLRHALDMRQAYVIDMRFDGTTAAMYLFLLVGMGLSIEGLHCRVHTVVPTAIRHAFGHAFRAMC